MANTSIKFRDSQDWTQVDGLIVDQSNLSEFYKDERVQPSYIPPEISTHVWNGVKGDVQHIRWDVWELEFVGKESELQKLATMQSSDLIFIEDIDNGLNHTVDMQISEWFSFAEPERVFNTTNWKLVLRYRTNKTIINKFDGLSDLVTLIGSSTYNSKYEKISFDGELEEIRVQWGEGGEKLLQETNNVGFKVLLYLSDSEKELFKNDWNQNTYTIDGTDIIRKFPLEISQLGEDNYQVVVSCITERETVNSTTAMAPVRTIKRDNGFVITTYESKFDRFNIKSEVDEVTVPLATGSAGTRVLRSSKKSGYKMLYYFTESELDSLRTVWGTTAVEQWTFDGVTAFVEQLPLEIEEMISGLFKVVVSAYYSNTSSFTADLAPDSTHTLVVTDSGTFTFYTDYPTEANVDDTQKDTFTNEDGLPVDSKTIDKQVTNIKLFLNTVDKNSLKLHYERGTATIDAVPILYRGIVNTNKLGNDLWEVDISDITTTPVPTYPL